MPASRPAVRRSSRWRRVVAKADAGAMPTASSPCARPRATTSSDARTRRGERTAVGTAPSCRPGATAATRRTCARRHDGRVGRSARAPDVAQPGQQAGTGQQPDRPLLGHVDHHGLAGLARADERDDAVAAGVGALHDALVAVDGQAVAVAAGVAAGRVLAGWTGRTGDVGSVHARLLAVCPRQRVAGRTRPTLRTGCDTQRPGGAALERPAFRPAPVDWRAPFV